MSIPTRSSDANYLLLDDAALLDQCEVDTYRASGPGGQKRNKTSSAVRLRHRPTELIVIGTESRSQHENKARALKRLRLAIALHVRRTVNPDVYEPSPLLRECVTDDGRFHVGRRDERFLPAAAEVLDVLLASGGSVREAATRVGSTTARLVDFLQREDKLWAQVNELRKALGKKPLR
jgi:hypothetical protein